MTQPLCAYEGCGQLEKHCWHEIDNTKPEDFTNHSFRPFRPQSTVESVHPEMNCPNCKTGVCGVHGHKQAIAPIPSSGAGDFASELLHTSFVPQDLSSRERRSSKSASASPQGAGERKDKSMTMNSINEPEELIERTWKEVYSGSNINFLGRKEIAVNFAHAVYWRVVRSFQSSGAKGAGEPCPYCESGEQHRHGTPDPFDMSAGAQGAVPEPQYDPRKDPNTNWVLEYAIELENIQRSRNHMLEDERGNRSPVLTRGTIIDTIWKYLATPEPHSPPITSGYVQEVRPDDAEGPSCHVCGAIMVPNGRLEGRIFVRENYVCLNCGATTGCTP